MDLSFIDSIKQSDTTLHISIAISAISFLIAIITHFINRGAFKYFTILAFAITIGSVFIYTPIASWKEAPQIQNQKSEKLIKSLNDNYGINISKSDSISIIDKYENKTPSKYTKIYVRQGTDDRMFVLYYIIEDSKLNFYKDSGNDTFLKLKL